MNSTVKRTIERCSNALNYGGENLSETLGQLSRVGIDSCHADYRGCELTFYSMDGDVYSLPMPIPGGAVVGSFDEPALSSVLSDAICGRLRFPDFKARTIKAGCIGVVLWLATGHITCFGQQGEIHDELLG